MENHNGVYVALLCGCDENAFNQFTTNERQAQNIAQSFVRAKIVWCLKYASLLWLLLAL